MEVVAVAAGACAIMSPVKGPANGGHASSGGDLSAAVLAAQQGDEPSFRLVYRAVQPLLLRYLSALVGDDAEDVASETWLQIARDLRSFRGDYDNFRGWAATIARHRAMDHVRRLRRRPADQVSIEEAGDPADGTDAATLALDAASTQAALRLIRMLPRDQAEAVLLRVVMGLDTATAARVLGKRVGAVRTAAYRGLRRLADLLDRPNSTANAAPGFGPGGPAVTQTRASALRNTR